MSATRTTTQAPAGHGRHRRPADDVASTDLDPRAGGTRTRRCVTTPADAAALWSQR